jgi:hypothetical protein
MRHHSKQEQPQRVALESRRSLQRHCSALPFMRWQARLPCADLDSHIQYGGFSMSLYNMLLEHFKELGWTEKESEEE